MDAGPERVDGEAGPRGPLGPDARVARPARRERSVLVTVVALRQEEVPRVEGHAGYAIGSSSDGVRGRTGPLG